MHILVENCCIYINVFNYIYLNLKLVFNKLYIRVGLCLKLFNIYFYEYK